jgi:ribosomal protein S18 acetylase RimI-like enzyme
MTALTVRPMMHSDIPVVASWLVTIPLWQRYNLTEAQAQASLEQGLRQVDMLLVADTRGAYGQACGLVWCMVKGAFGRSAYLRLLGVRSSHTGRGIGTALLRQAERLVVRTSSELFLLVSDFNINAQRFYQREGYERIGAIPGYILPDVTELLYWKRLQSPLR